MTKLMTVIMVIILILLIFPKSISANEFFFDFNTLSLLDWDQSYGINNQSAYIDGGSIHLRSVSPNNYPYLIKEVKSLSDTEFEIKFKFLGNPNYGSGIVLSDKALGYEITNGISWNDILFNIWANPNTGFSISTRICPKDESNCITDNYNSTVFTGNSNEWYEFKLVHKDNSFIMYVDNVVVYESSPTDRVVDQLWIGSPEKTGNVIWPELLIDTLAVSKIGQRNKVVIIPGLGSTWDIKAMLGGVEGADWKIPEYVDTYDSLIKSLENAGYEKDKDLFIFSYDWRKPVDRLSDELSAFIIGHTESGEKINIIGHSMGGLVSRIYAQKHGSEGINKIITLGTPNTGSLEAYSVWEGAQLWRDVWWGKAAIELVVQLNQKPGESRVDTLRSQAPSIKDLLPTYDFIVKNGNLQDWSGLKQKNDYLQTKNSQFNTPELVVGYAGVGEDTKWKMNSIDRSNMDKVFGMWEDGKPDKVNPFMYYDGDGTVTRESALFTFNETKTENVNHIGLPKNAKVLENIFNILDLDTSEIEIVETKEEPNVFAVFLRSPGRLEVCNIENVCNDGLGVYDEESKYALIPGTVSDGLKIRVHEQGQGAYRLHVGSINSEAKWEVISGEINKPGQVDEYIVDSVEDMVIKTNNQASVSNILACKSQMDIVASGWDKRKDVESLLKQLPNTKQAINLVSLLRVKLKYEIWKAKDKDRDSVVRAAMECWESFDRVIVNVLEGDKERGKVPQIKMAELLLRLTDKSVSRSSNKIAHEVFILAKEKLDQATYYESINKKLGRELAESADGLALLSLGLK